MKGPRPSLREKLTGGTVEVEVQGSDGRPSKRIVSKKWFDEMVAQGRIKEVDDPSDRGTGSECAPSLDQLAERAKRVVKLGKMMAIMSFTGMLDHFPDLARVKPDDWDLFLHVASVEAAIRMCEWRFGDQLGAAVRATVRDELASALGVDGPRALADCEGFVERSLPHASEDTGDRDPVTDLQGPLGMWVVWNLFGEAPSDSDLRLVGTVGGLVIRSTDGWWTE